MVKQGAKMDVLSFRRWGMGCGVGLLCYLMFQFLLALLLNNETLGLDGIYVALGPVAGISVLLGAMIAGKGQGNGRALIAGTVLAGFLLVLLAISMMGGARPWAAPAGGSVLLGSLTGAMIAALVGGGRKKKTSHRRK